MTETNCYFSKVILRKGEGLECPNEGSSCIVNVRVNQGDWNVLYEEKNVKWIVGQDSGYVSEILNECVEEMHVGELCKITLHLCDELQDHLISFNSSEQQAVDYELQLVSIEKAKESWESNFIERCKFAQDHKEKGTRYYKAGLWLFAAKHYSKAIKSLLLARCQLPSDASDLNQEELTVFQTQCYSNLAACQLKLQRYQHVIENCTKALKLDSSNVKALFRRCQAHTALNDFDKAEADMTKALQLDPGNRETLQLKRTLDGKVKQHNAVTAKAMSKMFQSQSH